jgi:hypothetical protein
MYDLETLQAAYKQATDEQKSVVDSDIIPVCVRGVVITNQLDESHFKKIVRIFSLFVLGVLTESQVISHMRELGVPEGKNIFDSLQSCKSNRVADESEAGPSEAEPASETEAPVVQENITATPPEAVNGDLSSDIAEIEATLEASPHIRTMSNDIAVAQSGEGVTHVSSQDNIIEPKAKEASLKEPRWETD